MKNEVASQWILLRGLAREARHWGEFPKLLQRDLLGGAQNESSNSIVRIDCLDLPGMGAYSEMRSPLSIAALAEFARDKMIELRRRRREEGEAVAQRAYIIAQSLGGMVASYWIHEWPRDFDGCVLINTSFRGYSPFYQRLRPSSLRHLANILRSYRDAIDCERNVLRIVSNRPELYEQVAREWGAVLENRPVSPENFARQLIAAARFQAPEAAPEIPVLVLNSARDRMVHPSCSQEVARRWKAEFRQHPTAGHDIPLDDGPWVAREIAAWVKTLR